MSQTNYQFLLRNISHLMKQLGDQKLESYGLTSEQGHIVGYLVHKIDERITQKDLEKQFHRKGSTISSIITNLEKNNFVERKVDLSDERRKIIRPLQKAIDLTATFALFFDELEVAMVKDFSEEEKALFTKLLERTTHNLTEMKHD